MILHQPFPKMARMFRKCVITEKIDGTNACIHIAEGQFLIGSRTRWITPDDDNHGFAKWATLHRDQLETLGPGTHFGEWWGSGVQRGYGLTKGEKRFSLFNTLRWCPHGQEPKQIVSVDPTAPVKMQDMLPPCCDLVPVLFEGLFDSDRVSLCIDKLVEGGSYRP